MRVLVTGAYGFIGTQVVATLMASGHTVIGCVRDIAQAKNRFPNLKIIQCDFRRDNSVEVWINRLKDIDAVVNCVGILHSRDPKIIRAIHYETPRALFEACANQHKKIVHISALGADQGVDTLYAKTKLALEQFLKTLKCDWVILRPSLVYGSGSFGGTSLFRALAAFPFVIPMVGKGQQLFQPIHIQDLAKTIQVALENPEISRKMINVVGVEKISLEQLLFVLRNWLGFGKAKSIHIPLIFIKPMAYLGDFFQDIPINTTSYKMLNYNNIGDSDVFIKTIGFKPRSIFQSLIENPSSTQDRWHARLYFLNPLLRISLGFLWVLSGFIPLFFISHQESFALLQKSGLNGLWSHYTFYGSSGLDFLLGFATLINWKIKWVGSIQIGAILFYTIFISIFLPEYWLDPFGSIVKNIPILIATLVMMALSEAR